LNPLPLSGEGEHRLQRLATEQEIAGLESASPFQGKASWDHVQASVRGIA